MIEQPKGGREKRRSGKAQVEILMWIAVLSRIDTINILESWRSHQVLSLDICWMCFYTSGSKCCLFLFCSETWNLQNRLFSLFGIELVFVPNLEIFISSALWLWGKPRSIRRHQKGLFWFVGHLLRIVLFYPKAFYYIFLIFLDSLFLHRWFLILCSFVYYPSLRFFQSKKNNGNINSSSWVAKGNYA